ncbi:MAG: glutamate-5-semialdehyde dehydrogenase [Phycisphaeraceae bacterium]|nr:MAG: glutamate-5-semialdehyde dehydrogenase [Phycisphaeraceae bacterium]
MNDRSGQNIEQECEAIARRARAGSRRLAAMDADERAKLLRAMAAGIEKSAGAIEQANRADMEAGKKAGLAPAMLDRLLLTPERISAMARGLRDVADQPDPLGATLETIRRPNGLEIRKVRAPMGVILVIYESRPNVTADAAGLCFKAGSACILRGGSEAAQSNRAIVDAMLGATGDVGDAVQLVPTTDRAAVRALLQLDQWIDMVVPRGGEGLIRAVAESSRIPVLKHYKGVCHVYVDEAADLEMALRIAVNAKCQRPGVCNAMETLLAHRDVADVFLPRFFEATRGHKLEIRGCERTRAILPDAKAATDEDWTTEYLDMILSVRIVDDIEQAIDHIETHGSRHSDAIVTEDAQAAERFTRDVDSATVYVNASTRFTDGAEFGKGAEVGISTDKLHARGPCGVEELTTYKYVIQGRGQIRE